MARVVNKVAHAARRNAILDAAERAVATIGYEQMAIGDLLAELRTSSGAFYHYFDSKSALLIALVERMGNQLEQRVLPIVHDPTLPALEKLRRFFAALDQGKLEHKGAVLSYVRTFYADDNAIFRHKLYMSRITHFAPLLEHIIQQGVREGTLTTPYPDQTARLLLSLLNDLGYATAELLISAEHTAEDMERLERIVHATTEAMERVLGTPAGTLPQPPRAALAAWLVPTDGAHEDPGP